MYFGSGLCPEQPFYRESLIDVNFYFGSAVLQFEEHALCWGMNLSVDAFTCTFFFFPNSVNLLYICTFQLYIKKNSDDFELKYVKLLEESMIHSFHWCVILKMSSVFVW